MNNQYNTHFNNHFQYNGNYPNGNYQVQQYDANVIPHQYTQFYNPINTNGNNQYDQYNPQYNYTHFPENHPYEIEEQTETIEDIFYSLLSSIQNNTFNDQCQIFLTQLQKYDSNQIKETSFFQNIQLEVISAFSRYIWTERNPTIIKNMNDLLLFLIEIELCPSTQQFFIKYNQYYFQMLFTYSPHLLQESLIRREFIRFILHFPLDCWTTSLLSLDIPQLEIDVMKQNKQLGYCGLKNLSNTCHFNAAIQLLFMCIPFRMQVFQGKGPLNELFQQLRDSNGYVDTKELIFQVLGKEINIHEQLDTTESLLCILDKFYEMNPQLPNLFKSKLKQSLTCSHCGKPVTVISEENIVYIGMNTSVSKGLQSLYSGENVEIHCGYCKCNTQHILVQCELERDKIMIVGIGRFHFEKGMNIPEKDDRLMEIDWTIDNYDLIGVIVHSGVYQGGHYYTIAKGGDTLWYELNDRWIKKRSKSEIVELIQGGIPSYSNGYVAMYSSQQFNTMMNSIYRRNMMNKDELMNYLINESKETILLLKHFISTSLIHLSIDEQSLFLSKYSKLLNKIERNSSEYDILQEIISRNPFNKELFTMELTTSYLLYDENKEELFALIMNHQNNNEYIIKLLHLIINILQSEKKSFVRDIYQRCVDLLFILDGDNIQIPFDDIQEFYNKTVQYQHSLISKTYPTTSPYYNMISLMFYVINNDEYSSVIMKNIIPRHFYFDINQPIWIEIEQTQTMIIKRYFPKANPSIQQSFLRQFIEWAGTQKNSQTYPREIFKLISSLHINYPKETIFTLYTTFQKYQHSIENDETCETIEMFVIEQMSIYQY